MTSTTAPRTPVVPVAWFAGVLMVALATSIVGLVVAPVAIPAALFAAARVRSWAVRVPLLLGVLALSLLVGAWVADGADLGGSTVTVEG